MQSQYDEKTSKWAPPLRISILASVGFLFVAPYLLSGLNPTLLAPALLFGFPMIALASIVYSVDALSSKTETEQSNRLESSESRAHKRPAA